MYDFNPVGTHIKEMRVLTGRLQGAGNAVPTPTANVPDSAATRLTITQAATGNYAATFLDLPIGVMQSYDWWVTSNNVADRNVRVTPPAAATPYTFQLNVTFMANGVACNVAAGEELHFFAVAGMTKQP